MAMFQARLRLEEWVAELDKKLGWTTTVSADGACSLQTKDGVTIGIQVPETVDMLMFVAPVGELSEAQRNDPVLLRRLLSCNWFGAWVGPGALGLEPDGGHLILSLGWMEAGAATSVEQFLNVLLPFAKSAERLAQAIRQGDFSEGQAAPAGETSGWSADPMAGMIRA